MSKAIKATKELQKLLPGTKAAKIFNTSFTTNGEQSPAFIAGADKETLQTVTGILKIAGFEHVQSINLKTRKNEKTI
jgi:hypothetical protein